MAEALTRQQSRRKKKALPAPGRPPRSVLAARDARERELKRLRLSVCDDVGFRLYLATYDQPKRRDELITRITREAEVEKVRVTRLDLAEAGPETNLVGLLRAHLQKTDLPPGWRLAVMVTGIEQRLDYARGREGYAFLHQANLLRDELPEASPVPVVLWLSRLASAALPAEAPDLWHWRAANFDFTGDTSPRVEMLRELTTLKSEEDLGLSGEQRRARLRMLEDLLAELEREGPPRSKRQKAERADLLLEVGIEVWHLGRAVDAISGFERALRIFREIGDQQGEANALGNLGNVYYSLGAPRRAIEQYEQHLAIARELNDRRGEGMTLGNLGTAYADLGEPAQAIEHYERSLAIAREIGDRQTEGNALGNLGIAYEDLGEPRRAIEHYEQSLAIAHEIGDRRGEGTALGNLGIAYHHLGEPRRAIEHYEQALTVMRESGNRRGEGTTLGNLGNAYRNLGEPRRAIDHYERSLAIARKIGDRQTEGAALGNLGIAYHHLGEPRRAIEHDEQYLAISREIGDPRGEGNSLYNSALAFDQLGERAEAIRRMEDALRIYQQIEDPNAKRARAQLGEWRGEGGG